jgi:ubiquinone/menaquinone biosynthesis C-methylase UbiE
MEQLAGTPGFQTLRAEIISLAALQPAQRVLDIGAGTGLLTLSAASRVAHVTALDISDAMCSHLEAKLARQAIANVDVVVGTATALPLADESVDVVVSNYCFHHLRDDDKRRALAEVVRVLRPGGRLVVGDMMFRLGIAQPRDRAVLAKFALGMLRRGPAGLIRLLRNALRFLRGRGEHPASIDWWRNALQAAGLADVNVRALEHEGAIATASRQGTTRPQSHARSRGIQAPHRQAIALHRWLPARP